MFRYPAIFDPDPDDGSLTVTFPDFGYGVTQGSTLAEAEDMAADLLACLMTDCMEKRADFPKPGKLRGKKIRAISLPSHSWTPKRIFTPRCERLASERLSWPAGWVVRNRRSTGSWISRTRLAWDT